MKFTISSNWPAEFISYLIACNIIGQFLILIKVDKHKVPTYSWGIIFQYCNHSQKTTAFDGNDGIPLNYK